MPSSDYGGVVGGALKLKGSAGVDKKRKKKKPKPTDDDPARAASDSEQKLAKDLQSALADEDALDSTEKKDKRRGSEDVDDDLRKEVGEHVARHGKTEAERRHDERRRKRLEERLKREGVKTHKERVQELNQYLSNLSEHHDMPKIGPG
ncbi:hypothetical protein BDY21DRAFT_367370 [Lineolata rhizophorae]|uniref:DUF1754-domain-containing protein n=1 Tax=Lineolata rhizophorae TaxID=578093 RepID=A0A6A6NMT3_9PEZI|nr:hypothetical protein BDY21DRAFT_367370 [Lineolata rhizophorae]